MYKDFTATSDAPTEVHALVLSRPLITPKRTIDVLMKGDELVVVDGVIINAKPGQRATHKVSAIFSKDLESYEIMMVDLTGTCRFKVVSIGGVDKAKK